MVVAWAAARVVHRVHAPPPQASRQRQLTGVVFCVRLGVGGWGLGVGCGSIRALSIMRRWLTVAGDWWGGEAVDLGADRSAVNDCSKPPDRHRREVYRNIRIGQVLREWSLPVFPELPSLGPQKIPSGVPSFAGLSPLDFLGSSIPAHLDRPCFPLLPIGSRSV